MPRSSRDEEFSAFVQTRLVRSACLPTAGDTHLAEDLVGTALGRLHVAWPKVRRAGTESAYVWRIVVNAHIDSRVRQRRAGAGHCAGRLGLSPRRLVSGEGGCRRVWRLTAAVAVRSR